MPGHERQVPEIRANARAHPPRGRETGSARAKPIHLFRLKEAGCAGARAGTTKWAGVGATKVVSVACDATADKSLGSAHRRRHDHRPLAMERAEGTRMHGPDLALPSARAWQIGKAPGSPAAGSHRATSGRAEARREELHIEAEDGEPDRDVAANAAGDAKAASAQNPSSADAIEHPSPLPLRTATHSAWGGRARRRIATGQISMATLGPNLQVLLCRQRVGPACISLQRCSPPVRVLRYWRRRRDSNPR